MAAHVLKFVHLAPQKDCVVPEPRSGHRVIALNGNLFSLGGYNPMFWNVDNDEETNYPLFRELWRFNLASRKWVKMKTTGHMPKQLASHAALLHGKYLVVLGGTGVPFGETASNELNVCDLNTMKWYFVKTNGDLPTPSYGHAMVSVEDSLFVFGGTTGWHYNADIHCLQLRGKQVCMWKRLEAMGDVPDGRYRHEMVAYRGAFYVLGGSRVNLYFNFKKLPVYYLEESQWATVNCLPDNPNGFPNARRCHGCVQLHENVYICGGYNGDFIYDDLWRLNMNTMQWTKMAATMPEPAYFHAATLTETGCMLVYGGVTRVDDRRTSNVYSLWLQMPSLKELTWASLSHMFPNLYQTPRAKLRELGIPSDLLSRLL